MTIICARFTRSLLPQYEFQLEQNSPAYFRGGSRNPLPLGAHICWQADFRPEWKYIATRTACALCLSSQATWACVGILGNLKEILTPLPYLDGHPWHWSSISGDRRGGGHPQPRTHPVSFMDDSPRMLYFFCGNPLLRRVRPVVPTLILLVTCHDPSTFRTAIKIPITIHQSTSSRCRRRAPLAMHGILSQLVDVSPLSSWCTCKCCLKNAQKKKLQV